MVHCVWQACLQLKPLHDTAMPRHLRTCLVRCRSAYWLGMYLPYQDPRPWPDFKWIDGYPDPFPPSYVHWGRMSLGGGRYLAEPNYRVPPEYCSTANGSQAFYGAWGWSDENCDDLYAFMCKFYPAPPPSPNPPPPSPPPPSPSGNPLYVDGFGTKWLFCDAMFEFNDAQQNCVDKNGFLAVYDSLELQVGVRCLLPWSDKDRLELLLGSVLVTQ